MPSPATSLLLQCLRAALGGALVAGCASAGRFLKEMLRERPPAALESMSVASDARVDSLGYIVGSFVGEGTTRAVHLLSSDTGFIAALVRRYRPALAQQGSLWDALARERLVMLGPETRRRTRAGSPLIDQAWVGGPLGHSPVTPGAILVHGNGCGWPAAQLEIIVEAGRQTGSPPLRGPVLGSFIRPVGSASIQPQARTREPLRPPGDSLTLQLITRTERVMDSALTAGYRSLRLAPIPNEAIEINTLTDIGAADVIPFRPRASAVRYAVSLRERRTTAGGDTLVASTVMVWDSTGAWQQTVFRPTLISIGRGRLRPYGAARRGLFWRRLQPISDFAFQRDNLWMEQIDVRGGSVLWGIVQPRENVVVAAAEVRGSCE